MTVLEGLSPFDKALVVIPCVTGSVSFVSSSIMAYMILADRKETTNQAKNRLLLGLCISDLFLSSAFACSTFPGPSYVVPYVMDRFGPGIGTTLIGTDFTCSLQAVFAQIGLCEPCYNAALCLYYLLIIRFNKTDMQLRTWVMPLIHFLIISFNIAGAAAGVALDAFHYSGSLGCYFQSPCQVSKLEGCPIQNPPNYQLLEYIFIAASLSLDFVVVVFSMATIYLTLRKVEKRSNRWTYEESMKKHQLPPRPSAVSNSGSAANSDQFEGSTSQHPTKAMKKHQVPPGPNVVSNSESSVEDATVKQLTEAISNSGYFVISDQFEGDMAQEPTVHRDVPLASDSSNPNGLPSVSARPANKKKKKSSITKGARDVGLQYCISFLITFVPLAICGFVSFSWARILMVIFTPLQGFWNLLFFLQRRVRDLTQKYPDASFAWKVWASIAAYPKYAR